MGANTREMEPSMPKSIGPSLRVIAVQDPKQTSGLRLTELPFPVKKVVYESILTHFEISPLFLTAALNLDAVYFKVRHAFRRRM